MISAIDTSILIAAMVSEEEFHEECSRLLDFGRVAFYSHGFPEAFSTLTGGRRFRLPASVTARILKEDYAPLLDEMTLSSREVHHSFAEAEARGIRGGAIFDYLHLVAARKRGADRFYTLNITHFRAFRRLGDPEITHPEVLRS